MQSISSSSFLMANFNNRSEVLAEFSIIIIIPETNYSMSFALLKFLFIANKKQKTLQIRHF